MICFHVLIPNQELSIFVWIRESILIVFIFISSRSAPILGAPIDICPGATGLPGGPGGGMGLPPPTMVSGSPSRPKSCCGLANIMTQALSVRWFIVLIAFVGVCCAVVGTVLGAMKASGREHLTVSLLMIGELQFFVFLTTSPVASDKIKRRFNFWKIGAAASD